MAFGTAREDLDFSDLQEVFDPFGPRASIDKTELDIQGEIEIINREIDEALEFYFKSDIYDCPKFSWEK